jgi:fatty acid desaturase
MTNASARPTPTNAASSGVVIDRKLGKQLMQRSDRPGLIWIGQWVALLLCTGYLLYLSAGSLWFIPMLIIHGCAIALPAYALSHECAHGTAFRTRWINETLFWISSLIYYEEPYYRRYAHPDDFQGLVTGNFRNGLFYSCDPSNGRQRSRSFQRRGA